jgi:thioredoxin-related protein
MTTSDHRPAHSRWTALPIALVLLLVPGCGSQTWRRDLPVAQREAAEKNRVVLLAFTKAFSPACWKMDSGTLEQSDIRRQLQHFICVQLDADRKRDVAATYGVRGVPTFIALHPDGGVLTRSEGYQTPESFLTFLHLAENLK